MIFNNFNQLFKGFTLSISICCSAINCYSQDFIDTTSRAKIFAEGVVSSPYTEWATSFDPDGKTVYFSRGSLYWTLCYSKMVDGQWGKPQVVNISGKWADTDPFISPDGKRMFFMSNRPLPGAPQDKHQASYHLWYADRISADQWGEPHHIAAPVNLDGVSNFAPSVSSNGTLYFCSRGRDGHDGMASFSAKWLGDYYATPKLLELNGKEDTQDPFIAPDESYIIFVSGNDLFISYHKGDDWSAAQKLNKQVNNGDSNSSPCVSRDGKTLYYSSSRIQGFFKRDPKAPALNYDGLLAEMQSIFNGQPNILISLLTCQKHRLN